MILCLCFSCPLIFHLAQYVHFPLRVTTSLIDLPLRSSRLSFDLDSVQSSFPSVPFSHEVGGSLPPRLLFSPVFLLRLVPPFLLPYLVQAATQRFAVVGCFPFPLLFSQMWLSPREFPELPGFDFQFHSFFPSPTLLLRNPLSQVCFACCLPALELFFFHHSVGVALGQAFPALILYPKDFSLLCS